MLKIYLSWLLFLLSLASYAQNSFTCVVRDSSTNTPMPGVTVLLQNTANGITTNISGRATLQNIPDGTQTIVFSFLGYQKQQRTLNFPLTNPDNPVVITLAPSAATLEEVLISSTRTNARIEDLPIRVEVLGQEEMDEESLIVPGNITSILGDLAIITVQRANPINGNDVIRMQGLDARYTQILRDGLPLYGGFSGSLGVLSIPPLDLKQVEIIKGSASTLYGGGAIGGLINFISKTPLDSAQTTFLANATTLREYNLNAFLSRKWNKAGLTFFAGVNHKQANDINKDGFAEVPYDDNITLHPRLFFYFKPGTDLNIGYTGTINRRQGGDIEAIQKKATSDHPFLQTEQVYRNMLELQFHHQLSENNQLTVKSAGNIFTRNLQLPGFDFKGNQTNTYFEINNLFTLNKHSLITGLNLTTETFQKNSGNPVPFANFKNLVPGIFVQHDWQLTQAFSFETGLRLDHHNRFGNFVLPRVSIFFKPVNRLSTRLAFGTGYKAPSLFDFTDPSVYLTDFASTIKAERSEGINADINYQLLLFNIIEVNINQAFYYTNIDNVNILSTNSSGVQTLVNGAYHVNSIGTDTYMRLQYNEIEFYLGYNHTDAYQKYTREKVNMPFNPRDKFSLTAAYEVEDNWRLGVEASYSGNQYIYEDQKVRNYWFTAAVIQKNFGRNSIVLNCENLFDVRQSRFESLVEGTQINPIFKPLYMPVEGRAINLSVKIAL